MDPTQKPGRRTVLRVGAAGGVALATFPLACGVDGASLPSGPIAAGNTADVAAGSLSFVPGVNALLGRDDGGLYAMSAVCTHAGCVVDPPGTTIITCHCHGSLFDRNGAVARGPAGSPLQHYAVEVAADGSITIQADQPVASSARTAVG